MTSVYSLYKELLPPSGIESCVEARFVSPQAINLIVSRGTVLQVFNVIEDDIVDGPVKQQLINEAIEDEDEALEFPQIKSVPIGINNQNRPRKVAKLELHAQFKLPGNVTSIGVIRTSTSVGLLGMDSLLLSFKDAKMSLIEYSQATHNIVTVSIHYYEREEFKKEHQADKFIPEIRVDPQNRCAIMQFYSDRLAVLPLKQDTTVQVTEADDATSKHPFHPSFVVSFSAIEPKMRNVADMVFLYGYFEPTLAILYEPVQTWTGRLGARKDTKCLIVVSLDITQRSYPILFRVDNLPYNCSNLMAVPSPVGGVLIFCPNALIHVDQTSVPGVSCAVNSYYGREALFPPPPSVETIGHNFEIKNPLYDAANVSNYKHLGLALDGSASFFLNPDTLLTVLRTGEMIKVDLKGGEGVGRGWKRRKGGVKSFLLTRLGLQTIMPSCGTRFGATGAGAGHLAKVANAVGRLGGTFQDGDKRGTFGYFFVGSRVADAMLIQFTETQHLEETQPSSAMAATPSADLDEMDLDDIYGASIVNTASSELPTSWLGSFNQTETTRFTFRICDSLICTGPIRDVVVGVPISYSTHPFASTDNAQTNLEVVTCAGEDHSGALGVLQRNIRPQIISSFEIGAVHNMWTVRCTTINERRRQHLAIAAAAVESIAPPTMDVDVSSTAVEPPLEPSGVHDRYMFMSKDNTTVILETGEEFAEVENKQFYKEGPTVAVGTLLDETCIVQVHQRGILVLDSDGTRTQELPIGDNDRWIVSCSILDPYVLVLLNVGEVILFSVNGAARSLRMCQELKDSLIASCCLYCDDRSGTLFPTVEEYLKSNPSAAPPFPDTSKPDPSSDAVPVLVEPPEKHATKQAKDLASANGLDADLYGAVRDDMADIYGVEEEISVDYGDDSDEDDIAKSDPMQVDGAFKSVNEENVSHVDANGVEAADRRIWCFVYREDGALEIFRLPDFQQCYFVPRFDLLPTVAFDQPHADPRVSQDPAVKFEEIVMINLGRDAQHTKPYFVGRTSDSDLVIYKAFIHLPLEDEPVVPLTPGNPPTTPSVLPRQSMDFGTLGSRDRLAIRFVRIPHDHISRAAKSYTDTEGDKLHPVAQPADRAPTPPRASSPRSASPGPATSPSLPPLTRNQYLKPFHRVGLEGSLVYSGIFMAGPRPCWIMVAGTGGVGPQFDTVNIEDKMESDATLQSFAEPPLPVTGKGALRVHPQTVDGAVRAFAPLHNVNVPNGFTYINGEGLLRICQLPAHFTYDADWPYCKVPLGRNAHKITYHYSTQTYVVSTSTPVPFVLSTAQHAAAVAAGVIEQGDELPETESTQRNIGVKDEDRDSGMYMPHIGAFSIELVSPVTWETSDAIAMEEHEHILAMQAVELESKQTSSGRKMFLAIGTGIVRGEDLATRGRILIYDIISVVPDPAHPHANHRFKRLFVNEEKGPVTALCNVGGYLLAAIGTKIIIHSFEDNESLTGVAFIDVNMYVNTVCAIKNLILVGDMMKSAWFLGFQEDPPKLVLLGKDYHSLSVYGLEFMVDDSALSFVVGDGDCNLHVMSYAPYHIQSSAGQKLIRRGDLHAGQHVSKMIRLGRVPPGSPSPVAVAEDDSKSVKQAKKSAVECRQQVTISGTLEGGLLLMVPVSEKLYKRLYGLYSKIVNNLQHPAGLNPRGFRQVPLKSRPATAAIATPMTGPPGPRLVLDGELLYQYASLSQNQQRELAKGIGSVSERILDDLREGIAGVEYF
ncbi:hypothetical protein PhCBS80983_g05700 [Powellomyces hirtus]|uniref:Cleavage and polyadenylation specificity factor subunit 1 n=1 Tax=Powellomyces hirtus TaxID=109895 RepID=A0A507DUG7_9FUNG|nr:hypothetical protein PhCBS80983_g05700 [Powellomyces hirtus]